MITVKSNLPDKSRVALWERDARHPDGEIYIADDQPHQVGDTPSVRKALSTGALVEIKPEMVVVQTEPPRLPALRPEKKGK